LDEVEKILRSSPYGKKTPPPQVQFLEPMEQEIVDINDPGWDDEEPDTPHPTRCGCYSCIGWDN